MAFFRDKSVGLPIFTMFDSEKGGPERSKRHVEGLLGEAWTKVGLWRSKIEGKHVVTVKIMKSGVVQCLQSQFVRPLVHRIDKSICTELLKIMVVRNVGKEGFRCFLCFSCFPMVFHVLIP